MPAFGLAQRGLKVRIVPWEVEDRVADGSIGEGIFERRFFACCNLRIRRRK